MTTILVVIFIFILALVIWALYGKTEESVKVQEVKEEELGLRRRASDKVLEEQFPDSEGHQFRRKEDIEAFEEAGIVEEDFKLPFAANEIIPEGSKYWVYNRTLINSEIYARKGDFPTAISLYRGVYERVIDQGINDRIKANVDYLQEYQKNQARKKSEAIKKKAQKTDDKKSNEIRLSLDGPLSIPEKIQIALTSPVVQDLPKFDINKIVDEIAEKVAAKAQEVRGKEEKPETADLGVKEEEISKIKDGLLKLHDRLIDINKESDKTKKGIEELKSSLASKDEKIEESEEEPSVTEARFQAPKAPLPDFEDIPPVEAPRAKPVEFQKEVRKQVEEEDEDKEEIELLSQFQKEEEMSGLSDEDIFEKILRDDISNKKDDSFEIVGYNREERIQSDGIIDKDHEDKLREEEQFYRKFLRHGKRVRKELPILKVSYDFSKLPDEFSLSKDQNILQYSFYKFKPMLEKANEFIKRRNVRDAINYYNVVKDQNIPPEFKIMLDKNINELTEYIEKYLTAD